MTRPLTLHAHEVRRLQHAGSVTLWRPVKPQPPSWCIVEYLTCPHGAPGTVAWVRETWRKGTTDDGLAVEYAANLGRHYLEDYPDKSTDWYYLPDMPWRSPVTMPRWASRLSVVVRAVTVKRTEQLNEDDALAAGFVAEDGKSASYCQYEDWERRVHVDYCWDRDVWAWAVAVTLAAA